MIRNYFTFGGEQSSNYGLFISGSSTYNSPERDIDKISVPGRSGDLLIDNGRFKNVLVSYPVFVTSNFLSQSTNIRQWLLATAAYRRLIDTYHTDEYRMAVLSGNLEWTMAALNRAGEATLVFNCKPQRFLISGETAVNIASGTTGTTLTNPTMFEAKPLIKVTGTSAGSITIGNKTITVSARSHSPFYIDCELGDAYTDGGVNCNGYISPVFPVLPSGNTTIKFTGLTKVEVTPRWWRV